MGSISSISVLPPQSSMTWTSESLLFSQPAATRAARGLNHATDFTDFSEISEPRAVFVVVARGLLLPLAFLLHLTVLCVQLLVARPRPPRASSPTSARLRLLGARLFYSRAAAPPACASATSGRTAWPGSGPGRGHLRSPPVRPRSSQSLLFADRGNRCGSSSGSFTAAAATTAARSHNAVFLLGLAHP